MTLPGAIRELEGTLETIRAVISAAERRARQPTGDLMLIIKINANVAQLRQLDGELARMVDQLRERCLRTENTVDGLRQAIQEQRAD